MGTSPTCIAFAPLQTSRLQMHRTRHGCDEASERLRPAGRTKTTRLARVTATAPTSVSPHRQAAGRGERNIAEEHPGRADLHGRAGPSHIESRDKEIGSDRSGQRAGLAGEHAAAPCRDGSERGLPRERLTSGWARTALGSGPWSHGTAGERGHQGRPARMSEQAAAPAAAGECGREDGLTGAPWLGQTRE